MPTPREKAKDAARERYQRAAGNLSPTTPEFEAALQAYWAELRAIKEQRP